MSSNPLGEIATRPLTIRNGVSISGSVLSVHEVFTDASGGTFRLIFEDGQVTANLDFDASAAEVDTALVALPGISAVTVTGTGTGADPWIITYDTLVPAGARPVGRLGVMEGELTGDGPAVGAVVTTLGSTPGLNIHGYNVISIEQPVDTEGIRWGFLGDLTGNGTFVDVFDDAGVRLFAIKTATLAEITQLGADVVERLLGFAAIQVESMDGSNVAVTQTGAVDIVVGLARM